MSDDNDITEALRLIRAAYAKGGRQLSTEETITFLNTPIYMGPPTTLPAKARGRKPTRTQYDEAFNRRKGLYQRLVRLPLLRQKASDARRKAGDPLRELILQVADKLAPTTPRYKLTSAILRHLEMTPRLPTPDATTVRRILKANR